TDQRGRSPLLLGEESRMMRRSLFMMALAIGLGLGTENQGWAAFGSFDFSTLVSGVATPGPPPTPTLTSVNISQGPDTTVTLPVLAGTGLNAAPPLGTDIVFGNINATKATTGTDMVSIAYDFRITITDHSPGAGPSDTAFNDINGVLSGSVTKNADGTFQFNI